MSARDLVIQTAVILLATGRSQQAAEAVSMAAQLVAEVERAFEAHGRRRERAPKKKAGATAAAARPAKKGSARARSTRGAKATTPRPLPVRALRVLERIGVLAPDVAPDPRELKHKVCEAHLYSAKNCGQATVRQVAAWFEEHGEALSAECATYAEDWMTNRCDAKPRSS